MGWGAVRGLRSKILDLYVYNVYLLSCLHGQLGTLCLHELFPIVATSVTVIISVRVDDCSSSLVVNVKLSVVLT